MRAELRNKKKLRWLIILMAIAIIAVAYDFRGFFDTAPPTLAGMTTTSAAPKGPAHAQIERETSVDLKSLFDQQQRFEIGARNIFRMQEMATPPMKSPDPALHPPGPTFADPPKPSLPFTFYGYADRAREPRRIFLQDSNNVFLAKIGDTVAGRYKVLEISRESVTIEDTLQNFQQRVSLAGR